MHTRIAIIGSGFAGLGLAIRLKQSGIHDFQIFERAAELGGTWRDNSYPGCTCDVESHLYSYSFAPNPRWSQVCSGQGEIFNYLRNCADRFGIRPHLRTHHNLESATWNAAACCWDLVISGQQFSCDVLVSATGALSEPVIPRLAGLEQFEGQKFHSARWNHDYDLRGKRVAVIGTGASAVQFVPAIHPLVEKMCVFQRTAPWVVPMYNRSFTEREHRRFERFPLLHKLHRLRIYLTREAVGVAFRHPMLMWGLERWAKHYLHKRVRSPELREKLTPNYRIGCKRILLAHMWYPTLTNANVELETSPIESVGPRTITTANGTVREIDAIVFGTGFQVGRIHNAGTIRGSQGKTLAETWGKSPTAYLGTTVTGFPNLFLLTGPNTGLGHSSVMLMAESQIAHIVSALQFIRRNGLASIEPKPEAQSRFTALVDRHMQGTVWQSGCKSWYLDPTGRNSSLWPMSVGAFRRRVVHFRPQDFRLSLRAANS
jgi:cation diffusion facilitator CzcD-associated flavoprotein CzcO